MLIDNSSLFRFIYLFFLNNEWKQILRLLWVPLELTCCNLIWYIIFAGRSRSFLASDRWRLRGGAFFVCLFFLRCPLATVVKSKPLITSIHTRSSNKNRYSSTSLLKSVCTNFMSCENCNGFGKGILSFYVLQRSNFGIHEQNI